PRLASGHRHPIARRRASAGGAAGCHRAAPHRGGRREFVANVSHELRTPVAALKALVETLEGGALEDDPEVARDFLQRMHIEVDGLANLVNELLDLARAEAGRLELDIEPCLSDDLLRSSVERMRPYAA